MERIITFKTDTEYSINTIADNLRNSGISCFDFKEAKNTNNLVDIDDACRWIKLNISKYLKTTSSGCYGENLKHYTNITDKGIKEFRKAMTDGNKQFKQKYNIGDDVWVKNWFNEPFSAKVDEVYITETKVCTIFEYKLTNGTASINRKQCEIFSSKEELLKSL